MPADPSAVLYRERLTVPVAWWVLSALFAASLLLAFGLYLGPVWGLGSAAVGMAAATALFAAAAVEVTVTESRLQVARAAIDHGYLGEALPLDPTETRSRRGPAADARAFLVLRPYISTAVEVTLEDAADPAPYWLVSTRRPQALAAALAAARSSEASVTEAQS